jgi:CHAT domain-containing protein
VDDQVTVSSVLEALPHAGLAHFACHGTGVPSRPTESCLLLMDGRLRVSDISKVNIERGELAFLSACVTGRLGEHLSDEVIHLANGFVAAGFRNVVSTLWPVNDSAAAELAVAFYSALAESDLSLDRSAYALRSAVLELRSRHRTKPSLWAAHVHSGSSQ